MIKASWRKCFLGWVALFLSVAPALPGTSQGWLDVERMLDGIAFVESSSGKFLVGDGGKSLGMFQLSRKAWADVNKARAKAGLATYGYDRNVMNHDINRAYARDFITILQSRLKSTLGRTPTVEQVYASFNMGFEGFRRCGFDINRVNKITRYNCIRVRSSYETASIELAMASRENTRSDEQYVD
jgi:hypothetical protein